MDQQLLANVKQALQQAESLGIAVGPNPTVDEMGAALALFVALKALNKKVSIASPTEPIVELSSLVGIDQVRNALSSGAAGDLVVSFPYKEGEIEKVSYTLENGFLNIVVKAGELGLNFTDEDVRFTHGTGGAFTHLFVIGASRASDVSNLFNPEEMKDVQVINIDNKPDNDGFGDIVIVSPRASSVSELVGEVLLQSGMQLDIDSAQNLLSGISYATSNFQDPKTSFLAFEMAGELMRLGAVRASMVSPTRAQMASIPQPRPSQIPSRDQSSPIQPMPARYPAINPDDNYADMPDLGAQAPQMARPQPRIQRPNPMNQRPPMPRQQQGQGPSQQGQQNPSRGQQNPVSQPRPQNAPRPQQQPMSQPQVQPQMQQRSRQDEIREELARAAAQNAGGTNFQDEPVIDAQIQDQPESTQPVNGRPKNPPADWLTPKVYKGSSDVNN